MHNPTTTNKKTNKNSFKYALTYIVNLQTTVFLKTKTEHNNSTHRKTYRWFQSLPSHQSLILNK